MIAGDEFVTLGAQGFAVLAVVLGLYALLGKPLFAVMGGVATLCYLHSDPPKDLAIIFVQMAQIVDQSVFVTIPLFVLAGIIALLTDVAMVPRWIVYGGIGVLLLCVSAILSWQDNA